MFFVMLIMFFVFMRVMHGRRCHVAHLHHGRHFRHRLASPAAAPEPSAFERLKQKYVAGDLTDEQYEDELDTLLRSPQTRKSVP
jgi:uncharacterized membrane protein